MEQLEKVEKLRQRANVSYEEAKAALEACNWDLLDAMVYLEKLGKVKGPSQTSYSTNYEEQTRYESVKDKIGEQKPAVETFWIKLKRLCRALWQIGKNNYFCVHQRDAEIIKVPVWIFVLALLISWELILVVMIVALFFQCKYSFVGKDNLEEANRAMEKASEVADKLKEEYKKL